MADFDPDAYLAATEPTPTAAPEFNPDEYLKATAPKEPQPASPEGGYFYAKAGVQPAQAQATAGPAREVSLGLGDILKGLVPTDLKSAVEFATPAATGIDNIIKAAESAGKVLAGESMSQATKETFPESYRYQDFGQKPLRQQVATVGGDVAQALMGAAIAAGFAAKPKPPAAPTLSETLGYTKPETLPTAAELAPEVAATNEALAKLEQPTTQQGVPNASEIQSTTAPDGGVRARSELGQLPEGNVEAANARLRSNIGEEAAQARQIPTEVGQRTQVPGSAQEVAPQPQIIAEHPIVQVPVSDITISKDVPQFKAGANERGIVEPLQGEYDPVGNVLQGWRRLNGKIELISGRHRFAKAQESGTPTVAMQIHDEANGFTKQMAARLDAELNIREGQGSVADYANYFRNSEISPQDAEARGLLARAKGKAGFSIGREASEDLFALHQSGKLTDSQAASIASAAPNNPGAQQVGIRAALEGKSADFASNLIKAATARTAGAPQTGDLFAFDDTAMRQMEEQAKRASEEQRSIREQISAVSGASKKPEVARKLGVDVKDPASVQAKVAELKAELARWENWPTQPDLVARTRGEPAPTAPKLLPGETQGELPTGAIKTPEQLAAEQAAKDAELVKLQQKQDVRVGAAKPLRAGEDVRPEADMFEKEVQPEISDWTSATKPTPQETGAAPAKPVSVKPEKTTGEGGFLGSTSGTFKSIAIRKRTQLDAATGMRSERLQKSFAEAQRAVKEIRKVAPTDRRQNAISVWMEAGGDRATIDQWAAQAKGKMFKRAAEDAKTLTPEEIAIAQKARAAFDVLSRRGSNYDILGAHRENYVPHVWDVTNRFTGIGSSKLQDQFKFNKARTFENFFEGDQAGFKPKTMAIGKVLPAYMTEMNKVIADRQFVQDISGMTAKDGRPLVVPRGNAKTVDTTDYIVRNSDGSPLPRFRKAVYDTQQEAQAALQPGQIIEKRPSTSAIVNPRGFAKAEDAKGNPIDTRDYKVVDQPALNDWRWVETDPQGNTTVLKSDLAVHPDLAKRLNAMTGQSAIRQYYNEPSTGLSVIPKAIIKGLDTAQSVMKREMFGLLAPFHQVQEGTHAVGHTVNPFSGIPDVSKVTPEMADAIRHGLMVLPEKTAAGSYMEGLGGKGTFISQAARFLGEKIGDNVAGKALRSVSDAIDGYQDFLFHKYIPGLKFKTYEHILERNMARYADDLQKGHVTESDVKTLSATQTDAAYGHLNYSLLDRNPTMQHIMQLTLLAPDFLEARARFTGQALKTLAGEKAGAEQFRAIAVLAATQAGVMYTLSKALGGEWDAKHPFEMVVNGRRYMLRSVPEDLHRLFFQGPDIRREFVSARINPTAQKIDQLRTGLNYRGEKTGATQTMEELLANYIPITARSIPGLRRLTETSRNNPVSPLEQLAGSLGLKISRYSPITKTHQLASEWMDKKGMARDRGSYPISKFQQLRYALEDGDLDRATKEWNKLASEKGADKAKLAKGFQQSINHPFTGSIKSDAEFAQSLSQSNRAIYDHANEVRKGIMFKFRSIYSGPTGRSKKSEPIGAVPYTSNP